VRVALLTNVEKTADHEARVRVLEKTINDMAADLRWLVLQQKNK
jgi:predicted ArsR family transcriptional regulator